MGAPWSYQAEAGPSPRQQTGKQTKKLYKCVTVPIVCLQHRTVVVTLSQWTDLPHLTESVSQS